MTARGSLLQVQIYVNRRPDELSLAVIDELPSLAARTQRIAWISPLASEGFKEHRDAEFLRAVGREDLTPDLVKFWPARGPVWDALAVAVLPSGRPGVLLAEGKSYPDELYGGGSKAGKESRQKIAAALEWTQERLGAPRDAERWLGPLYQTANRLAHLCWLREQGVEAWFVHLLFLDDRSYTPASRADWGDGLRRMEQDFGLELSTLEWVGHAFLPALAAEELTRQPTRA